MKLKNVAGLIIVFLAALLLAACSPQDQGEEATDTAQAPVVETEVATEPAATKTDLTASPAMEETPSAAEPMAILTSDLIGAPIEDAGEQAIGEVRDLLMTHAGNLQFLVVDYDDPDSGEARVVAVPWTQVEVHADETVSQDFAPVVVVEAGNLASAQDVDLDQLDINAPDLGDDEAQDDGTPELAGEFQGLVRVGQFTDFNLRNGAGEDLGEVEDLAIDLESNQIAYAVVDVGGFLGLGERTVAIPWQLFTLERTEEEVTFVASIEPEELENAPEVDLTVWPETTVSEWDSEIADYWNTQVD